MKASMYCPTCNGTMTQYVGFNEREPKPGTPFECVKGCVVTNPTSISPLKYTTGYLEQVNYDELVSGSLCGLPPTDVWAFRTASSHAFTCSVGIPTNLIARRHALSFTVKIQDLLDHVIPTLQTSAQQTQSQPATSAKAPTQPVWAPNTAKGLAQRGASAGSWKISLPDPDPGDAALRTHQPQGDSRPVESGTTIQQLTDKARALSEQPVDPERFWNKQYLESLYKQQLSFLLDDLFVRMTTPRILIPKHGYETSTYTSDSRSPSQTSAPATAPSYSLKARTSD